MACCRRSGASSAPGGPRRGGPRGCPGSTPEQFLGEPWGRTRSTPSGWSAAVLAGRDPEAAIGVFTADHVIEPVAGSRGSSPRDSRWSSNSRRRWSPLALRPPAPPPATATWSWAKPNWTCIGRGVRQFREKPDLETAQKYFEAGPSGSSGTAGCSSGGPHAAGLHPPLRSRGPRGADADRRRLGHAAPAGRSGRGLPALKKISVDYAVMEPASRDPAAGTAASLLGGGDSHAAPLARRGLLAGRLPRLARGTSTATPWRPSGRCCWRPADCWRPPAIRAPDCHDRLRGSGDLHTPDATLVCRRRPGRRRQELHRQIAARWGEELT